MHKRRFGFKVSRFGITIMAVLAALAAVITVGVSSVSATPGNQNACNSAGCHTYPAATLRVFTDTDTKTVVPGGTFNVDISWSGGSGRTEINWPNNPAGSFSNAQFTPTPRVPYSGSNASGSTSSTLTAPSALGTYTVRVYASKGSPLETYYKDMTVAVYSPLSVTTTSLPNGTVGVAYNQNVNATGGTTSYTWSVSAGSLPAGLALGSGGAITGTPSAIGISSFTVMVTDSVAATATKDLSITINPIPPLSVTTTSLPNGTVGATYNQNVNAIGGTTPYTWSISAGTLPAGLSLSIYGAITGTPTASGISSFTVMVADSASATTTKDLSINVNPASQEPNDDDDEEEDEDRDDEGRKGDRDNDRGKSHRDGGERRDGDDNRERNESGDGRNDERNSERNESRGETSRGQNSRDENSRGQNSQGVTSQTQNSSRGKNSQGGTSQSQSSSGGHSSQGQGSRGGSS